MKDFSPELKGAERTFSTGSTGGAWPFLVGGLPCQVDSGNERDLNLLTRPIRLLADGCLLRGTVRRLVDGSLRQ